MVVDGKMPRVRCTWRNRDGHQCGNLIAPGQVVCHVHRKVSGKESAMSKRPISG
jgi:hypothetical protein